MEKCCLPMEEVYVAGAMHSLEGCHGNANKPPKLYRFGDSEQEKSIIFIGSEGCTG